MLQFRQPPPVPLIGTSTNDQCQVPGLCKPPPQYSDTCKCAGGVGDPPRKPLELWAADTSTGQAKCLLPSPEWGLNGVFDECAPTCLEQ